MIGWAAAGLALVPLALMISSGWSDWPVLVALDVVILGIGIPFIVSGARRRRAGKIGGEATRGGRPSG
jgi:hypothetical protein